MSSLLDNAIKYPKLMCWLIVVVIVVIVVVVVVVVVAAQ